MDESIWIQPLFRKLIDTISHFFITPILYIYDMFRISFSLWPLGMVRQGHKVVTSLQSCVLARKLWPRQEVVTSPRSCDLITKLWPRHEVVTSPRSCDLTKKLWPRHEVVTSLKSCDLATKLWPRHGIVTSPRSCDLATKLWPRNEVVTSLEWKIQYTFHVWEMIGLEVTLVKP